jgi:hypothetical protein
LPLAKSVGEVTIAVLQPMDGSHYQEAPGIPEYPDLRLRDGIYAGSLSSGREGSFYVTRLSEQIVRWHGTETRYAVKVFPRHAVR